MGIAENNLVQKIWGEIHWENSEASHLPKGGLHIKFPLLKSAHHQRTLDTTGLESVTKFFKGFLTRQFAGSLNAAQVKKQVDQFIPCCAFNYPAPLHGGYDSVKFKIWLIITSMFSIFDDIFDDEPDAIFKAEGNEKLKKMMEIIHALADKEEGDIPTGKEKDDILKSIENDIFAVQLFSVATEVRDMHRFACNEGPKLELMMKEMYASYLGYVKWRKTEDLSLYSESTYKHIRRGECAITAIFNLLHNLQEVQLSSKNSKNCQLKELFRIGVDISTSTNDVFGSVEVDAEKEQCSNILIHKLKKTGKDFQTAMNEELEFLSEQIDDYIRLRSSILNQLKDDENIEEVQKYIESMDCFVDGNAVSMFNNQRWRLSLNCTLEKPANDLAFQTKKEQICEFDKVA